MYKLCTKIKITYHMGEIWLASQNDMTKKQISDPKRFWEHKVFGSSKLLNQKN